VISHAPYPSLTLRTQFDSTEKQENHHFTSTGASLTAPCLAAVKRVSGRDKQIPIKPRTNGLDSDYKENTKEISNHDIFSRRHASLFAYEL
jgi:hypothetical protein